MKAFLAFICLVALTMAEPPPSNSYLPPPSGRSGSSAGYPISQGSQLRSGPQVIAARGLGFSQGHGRHSNQGHHGANTFARNGALGHVSQNSHDHGPHGAQARFGQQQGYEPNAFSRKAFEDASAEPANYSFGYMVNNNQEGTDFGHHEQRKDERAEGEYHVVLPDGRKQTVSYEADERGFKPRISYEESDLARSGYDDNANNVNGYNGNDFSGAGFGGTGFGNHHGDGGHGSARSNGY